MAEGSMPKDPTNAPGRGGYENVAEETMLAAHEARHGLTA